MAAGVFVAGIIGLAILVLLPLWPCASLPAEKDPDLNRNASELIRDRGFPVEEHNVTTKDGFILNLQRIPHGRRATRSRTPKPLVFLQHGLSMDSTAWILNSPSDSLGYILADRGFDIWLGNIRGNKYSQRHVRLNPSQSEFWDWSWEEMAKYDLPAMLNYALNISGQSELFYVGHSQGSLIGFTGFSFNPDLARKVSMFFALAPVYTVGYCSSVIRSAAYALYPVLHLFQNYHNGKMVIDEVVKMLIDAGFCGGEISEEVCYGLGEELFGFDSSNINMSRVPVILSHWGSGTSFKNFIHFGQMVLSQKCTRFDYGFFDNYKRYGQVLPPEYHVNSMPTPTILFSGSNDKLADPKDVRLLKDRLKNLKYFKEIQGWNHADFLFGMDAPRLLYSKIEKIINTADVSLLKTLLEHDDLFEDR